MNKGMENTGKIKKVAVLGSGVMGSRIACHFANIGCEVLLLDILPNDEQLAIHPNRNQITEKSLTQILKEKPSPIYSQRFISRIKTGNFTDDFPKISTCDWIIEAVVERLDIKQHIFEQVERYKSKNAIVSTNTSGIPMHFLLEGRSEAFKSVFLGTHFFNPPRYLPLLEIIPTPFTQPEIIDLVSTFGSKRLGKEL